ncbi:hypothetical protein BKA62DRAFT_380983 [Auriculariales sp. MPI-PUGE-AT-0066]|nr:hypothetical protein BKA62DRAFT_380983 [Auriculariales sp. MPI-PUGE-AT-0066]
MSQAALHLPDILVDVLPRLPRKQMLGCRLLARSWRDASHFDTRFFLNTGFSPAHEDLSITQRIVNLKETSQYALKNDIKLSLVLSIGQIREQDGNWTASDIIREFCDTVQSTTHILVRLSVNVKPSFRDQLHAALCRPAPHLRVLRYTWNDDEVSLATAPIPLSLFSGRAESLRSIDIRDAWPEDCAAPLPVFTNVERLSVFLVDAVDTTLRLHKHFPRLRLLKLYVSSFVTPPTVQKLFLDGLHLSEFQLILERRAAEFLVGLPVEQLQRLRVIAYQGAQLDEDFFTPSITSGTLDLVLSRSDDEWINTITELEGPWYLSVRDNVSNQLRIVRCFNGSVERLLAPAFINRVETLRLDAYLAPEWLGISAEWSELRVFDILLVGDWTLWRKPRWISASISRPVTLHLTAVDAPVIAHVRVMKQLSAAIRECFRQSDSRDGEIIETILNGVTIEGDASCLRPYQPIKSSQTGLTRAALYARPWDWDVNSDLL